MSRHFVWKEESSFALHAILQPIRREHEIRPADPTWTVDHFRQIAVSHAFRDEP